MKPFESLFQFLVATCLVAACLAQDPEKENATKDDEDVLKAGREDPFTKQDPELMKEAGIISYGPFPWADFKTSDDIETVLGKGRFLWLETAHFRIGFNFKTVNWPEGQEKRKFLKNEIKEVRKRLKKFPEKPKKLTPWIRLHLYAYRLEKLYGEVQALLGVTDADFGQGKEPPNGPYLGMGDKFLVLLFQKESDLARYFERFCNTKADTSMRWYHTKTHQLVAAVAAQGLEGFDSIALQGHVTYAVTHNLLNGYKGFHMQLPMWLDEGLAHSFALAVPSDVVNVQILDTEAVSQDDKQANWPVKVRRRAQHDGAYFTFEQMVKWTKFEEMGYHAHSQSWSRVDYLLQLDREKVGLMIGQLKSMPPAVGGAVPAAHVATKAQKLLIELFELDAATFDTRWREWVLKTYPKK
ncbi:MAG: hypothetical protein KDC98_09565 [Planctomycetes bacterium]|nr:hypothetical protein [Planctomycetota bacterium]